MDGSRRPPMCSLLALPMGFVHGQPELIVHLSHIHGLWQGIDYHFRGPTSRAPTQDDRGWALGDRLIHVPAADAGMLR